MSARRLASSLAMLAGAVASVATTTDTAVEKEPEPLDDTGTAFDGSRGWSDTARADAGACESVDVAVTASLAEACLATPEADAWVAPAATVEIAWTVRVEDADDTGEPGDSGEAPDTAWDGGGGPSWLGDTGDTSSDTSGETAGDTSGDTAGDTGDTSSGDTGDTSGDTAGDTGDTCVAAEEATVRISVRDTAGGTLFETAGAAASGDPFSGTWTVDPAFSGCAADAPCDEAWTLSVVVEGGGPVEASVTGTLTLDACSAGNTSADSGAITVE
jgi:hypothetical protein